MTVKAAVTPLKRTAVAPVKSPPEMTTTEPVGPMAGVNPVMTAAPETTKLLVVTLVPAKVETVSGPVTALLGTVANRTAAAVTLTVVAATPPKRTTVWPAPAMKFAPLIWMETPTLPSAGLKLVMRGETVNRLVLLAVAPAVTLMKPLSPSAGTAARICVADTTIGATADELPNFT